VVREEEKHQRYTIPGRQRYRSLNAVTEGDWSQGAFFIAAGIFGGKMTVKGLDTRSTQGDRVIVDMVKAMGGTVLSTDNGLEVHPSPLKGVDLDISQCPDLAPILALLCALAEGKSRIYGGARLRIKESDRIQSVADALKAIGAHIQTTEDGFTIDGVPKLQGGLVHSYGDHRIAMMAGIAASVCSQPVVLDGTEDVNKSYPAFWEDYRQVGGIIT
jgi:3-phosphoshikimate 1-carboxyvinyltransferase